MSAAASSPSRATTTANSDSSRVQRSMSRMPASSSTMRTTFLGSGMGYAPLDPRLQRSLGALLPRQRRKLFLHLLTRPRGELDGELRPARPAVHRDLSGMLLHDLADEAQPESGALPDR